MQGYQFTPPPPSSSPRRETHRAQMWCRQGRLSVASTSRGNGSVCSPGPGRADALEAAPDSLVTPAVAAGPRTAQADIL